ncbi:MAG: tetratricopeptide repeat protein [Cyclobacteriaceae bacterium]|nr:tetratricopeptide repeat protein [Cyclobacteriaceae bacterium]
MIRSTLVLFVWLFLAVPAIGQRTLSQSRADQHFEAGLDRMKHRHYGAAFDSFRKFSVTASPTDPRTHDAAYYQAYCAVTLLHPDGEERLSRFLASNPDHPKGVLAYYNLANHFYDEKSYVKAANYFTKVNFQSLSQEQAGVGRFRWGYSLFSQRNLVAALDQFNAIKTLGGTYGPAASYYAGFIELSAGDYENALIDLRRAEKSESYASVVPPLIATTYQRMGKDDELIAYAEPLLDREDINTEEISLLIAEAWFRKANYAQALPRYEAYLEERETTVRSVYFRAGFSANAMQKDDQAVKFLKQAASDQDSVGMYAAYLLGTVYLKQKQKPLALTAFETSKRFKQDPRVAEESLFLSAKLNYDLGRSDLAITEFESVLSTYPQSGRAQEVKELLAQAYINANNVNKAIEYIESLPRRSAAVDRAYQKATYLKGTEYFNKEEYAQAAAMFQKSLQIPVDARYVAEASFWLGETFAIGKRWEEAVPHYEHTLAQPGVSSAVNLSTRYGLGYARYNLQQYDKALINFREFVAQGARVPHYPDGVVRLADCQYVLKAYPEALATYRKVIDLKSADSEYARLQAGIILGIQHRYSEAVEELTIVARNSGSRHADEARFQLGQLELERGNYPVAVNHFTTLISGSQSSRFVPYAYSRRAAAHYNLKNYGQTADDYIAVVEKYPAHPAGEDVLLPLQEALRLANRSEEFDKYLAQYKKANPDAKGIESIEYESAKSHYFNQQYPKAIESLAAFLRNYPQSAQATEATYYQGESYYRLKDYSRALDLHRQVSADPAFGMLNKSLARVAELEFRQQRYQEAVQAFDRLKRVAVNKKDEFTALNGLMESYFLLAQYDSADVYARKIQQLGSVNANAQSKASLFLGKSAKARGDYETAEDEFLATLNSAQDEYGAEAKYLLAEIFFLKGEHAACRETLMALNQDFAAYEVWVGKSFLLLADDYLATQEIFQAKGTLRSLIDNFPGEGIRNIATERLKAIEEKERKKREELQKKDTTDRRP